MKISIIIPCYNSEKYLAPVVKGIIAEFEHSLKSYDYQIVLVNDCSKDGTFQVIKSLCVEDENIVGIDLSRNYGQESAKIAGIEYACGDIIVFMDDDGQHPAQGIVLLVNKILEGYDVVYAKLQDKKHSLFKRITSYMHLKVSEYLEVKPKDIALSSFVAWSRFAVDCALNYKSPFPSVGTYLMKCTNKFANVEIEHQPRIMGKSNYSFKKLLNVALNNFTNFSIKPLRLVSVIGLLIAFFGFIFVLITVIRKLIFPEILIGYTSLISIMLIGFGMIMISLGVFGEYLGKIYMIISDQPQFTVKEEINSDVKK